MSLLKRLFQAISGKKYRKCPGAAVANPIEQRALQECGRYGDPDTVRARITAAEACEEKNLVFSALENLRSVFRLIKDKVNGSYLPKDYSAGILAWDLGRLVTVARMSLDCGYIEQHELKRILAYVAHELDSNFSSGQTMMLDGIIGIAEDLMTDKDSPWVLSPLGKHLR